MSVSLTSAEVSMGNFWQDCLIFIIGGAGLVVSWGRCVMINL